jgi:uncharacterized RDD family membrane protein YckC
VNDPGEDRCVHCGRHVHAAPAPYPIRSSGGTAAAPALQPFPGEDDPAQAQIEPQPRETPNYQPSLFRDGSAGSKVIPIPTLTPLHPYHRGTAARRQTSRAATTARPHHRRSEFQQTLGFPEAPAEVRIQPGEAIDCDAPVAGPEHRLLSTVVDAGLILAAVVIFLVVFLLSGGQVTFDRQAFSFLLGVTAAIALFYRALWCLANGDSPGMRVAGLRLVDFDGKRPDREQRGVRQVASLLSVLSAGLGLIWALVDEEKLTWHDHISKTFPTLE